VKIIWSIFILTGELYEFLRNRQILFLVLLYWPACFALIFIFNNKAAGSKSLRLFYFRLLAF